MEQVGTEQTPPPRVPNERQENGLEIQAEEMAGAGNNEPVLPMVKVEFKNLNPESKWRLEQSLRLWMEWQEQLLPIQESWSRGMVKGKSGEFLYSGGSSCITTLDVDGNPENTERFMGLTSQEFNMEYEKVFGGLPLYDRHCEVFPGTKSKGYVTPRCFNCGSYHHGVRHCFRPYNLEAINKSRAQYKGPIGKTPPRNRDVPGDHGGANRSERGKRYMDFDTENNFQREREGKRRRDHYVPGDFSNVKAEDGVSRELRTALGVGAKDNLPWQSRQESLGGVPQVSGTEELSPLKIFGDSDAEKPVEGNEMEEAESTEEGEVWEDEEESVYEEGEMVIEQPSKLASPECTTAGARSAPEQAVEVVADICLLSAEPIDQAKHRDGDKEEGELDVEEGEIVETPPRSPACGVFFPVAEGGGCSPHIKLEKGNGRRVESDRGKGRPGQNRTAKPPRCIPANPRVVLINPHLPRTKNKNEARNAARPTQPTRPKTPPTPSATPPAVVVAASAAAMAAISGSQKPAPVQTTPIDLSFQSIIQPLAPTPPNSIPGQIPIQPNGMVMGQSRVVLPQSNACQNEGLKGSGFSIIPQLPHTVQHQVPSQQLILGQNQAFGVQNNMIPPPAQAPAMSCGNGNMHGNGHGNGNGLLVSNLPGVQPSPPPLMQNVVSPPGMMLQPPLMQQPNISLIPNVQNVQNMPSMQAMQNVQNLNPLPQLVQISQVPSLHGNVVIAPQPTLGINGQNGQFLIPSQQQNLPLQHQQIVGQSMQSVQVGDGSFRLASPNGQPMFVNVPR